MNLGMDTGRLCLRPDDAEKAVQNVIAMQRLEGLYLTEDEIFHLRLYAEGKITESEYMAWVLSKAGVSR